MRLKELGIATLAGWLLITPAMASDDCKAEVEKWKAEAKKWEAVAKGFEAKYGWINDKHEFCSMNRYINNFLGYDGPNCIKPMKPFCAVRKNCSESEVQFYKIELENWVMCRKKYIREGQDDAGCALVKIRKGIDQAIKGE